MSPCLFLEYHSIHALIWSANDPGFTKEKQTTKKMKQTSKKHPHVLQGKRKAKTMLLKQGSQAGVLIPIQCSRERNGNVCKSMHYINVYTTNEHVMFSLWLKYIFY